MNSLNMKAILKIDNFSNYEIYPKEGKIWSLKSNKFIGSNNNKCGYWSIALTADDGTIWGTVLHRIIYTACYGEIPKGYEVNHIDEDKNNNSVCNLNLMTHQENLNWGTRIKRCIKATRKAVGAYKNNVVQFTFSSMAEAQRNGFDSGTVCKCCKGKLPHYKGYEWRYID